MTKRIRTGVSLRSRSELLAATVWTVLVFVAVPAAAENGSFQSGGQQLHYRSDGTGPPIVLLSGGPGFNVDYLIPAAQHLPAGYTRVFLEQRGTGRSQPVHPTPETMTLRLVVDDLESLRMHLRQDRLFLVGHSWGGMLAMAYAAAHPDRVDRMILIASGGPTLEFTDWFSDNIRARLRPEDVEAQRSWGEDQKRGADPDKVMLEGVRAITPGYFFDRAKALAFAAQLTDGTVHRDVNTMLFADLAKTYDLRAGLGKLTRPVLIVHGHQDPIGDKTAETIHSAIASSTLVYIKQCGHFPWVEQPETFRKILAAFFAKPSQR
jgi:proline iminopeptidase